MLVSITFALATAAHPCGTALFAPELPPPPPRMMRAMGVGALPERDIYGVPSSVSNDRFIVRWGPDGGDLTSEANGLLANLDQAWAVEIDELGHPAPPTSESYKFNVYVGDSGGGAPPGYGAGGYFYTDEDGFPMLVIALDSMADAETRQWTSAHEFYHAVQYGMNTYSYDGEGAWFWEATAEWAATVVAPQNSYHGSFLGPYTMLSYLGIPFFDYPDEGLLEEYHQYGAYIFPRFVSEKLLDNDAIKNAWLDPDPNNEPMLALAQQIEESGVSLADALADYAAASVTWDYAAHDMYVWWASAWVDYYPELDATIVGPIPVLEDDVAVAAPSDTLPERFAFNLLRSDVPETGRWRVIVDGAGVAARLVVEGATTDVHPVEGALELDLEAGDRITLAVAAVDSSIGPRARTAYGVGMRLLGASEGEGEGEGEPTTRDDDDDDQGEEPPPFSCATTAAGAQDMMLFSLLALLSLLPPKTRAFTRRSRARQ